MVWKRILRSGEGKKFKALRDKGSIAAGTKFMVALPTPLAIAIPHISPSHIPDFLKVYERSLIADLKKILAGIPAADLSIQWDIQIVLQKQQQLHGHSFMTHMAERKTQCSSFSCIP